MRDLIKALLSESGVISTARVMSLGSLVVGSVIGLYGVYMGKDLGGIAQVCSVFVGSAFAAKVTQKYMESK